jgi:hypothetical protein
LALGATSLGAQQDSTKCDSIVGAARIDVAPAGLFLSANRMDGSFSAARAERIVQNVGAAFTPPKPFKLNVFAGPSRPQLFRRVSDTAQLRSPTLTGVYRVTANSSGQIQRVEVTRPSLMEGFDSAAVRAIRATTGTNGLYIPLDASQSAVYDVKFSTDSSAGADRLVSADFPVMRVIDATPIAGAPAPFLPDSLDAEPGEVVLRFVVHRDGTPDLSTIEVLRTPTVDHLKATFKVLPQHRFKPATIAGCPVAQRVDYAFVFHRGEPRQD